jgi:hypothetical protein
MNRNYKQTTIRLRETAVVGVKETGRTTQYYRLDGFFFEIASTIA